MLARDKLVRSSVWAVAIASVANGVFAVSLIAALGLSLVMGDDFTQMLLGADAASKTAGARWELLLGLAMAGAIHMLLRALARIVATVSAGDPFIADNAKRLRNIGWSLLALQLLDFPAMIIAHRFPELGAAAPDGGISPAGWLAAAMTFILARVFTVGSAMRDDLEGTV